MIEVYGDVACPFTHVALRRIARCRSEAKRGDVVLHLRAWPLELVDGEPSAPELVAERVAALRASVAPELFGGFDSARFPMSSLPALALAARANRSSPGFGEVVGFALRDALFEEGRDLTDSNELAAIGERCGCESAEPRDAAAVIGDWSRGRGRGVIASPHLFLGSTESFCPVVAIDHGAGGLGLAFDPVGLDAFVERCFTATRPYDEPPATR